MALFTKSEYSFVFDSFYYVTFSRTFPSNRGTLFYLFFDSVYIYIRPFCIIYSVRKDALF